MLPDIGASELLLIAVVALIVVGPKDLPLLMRKVGQFLARLRGMAAEFRASFDEMARQSELDELRREVEAMRSGRLVTDALSGAEEPVRSAISDIEQSLADTGAQFHPPMSHQIAPPLEIGVTPEPEAKPAPKPRARKPKAAASEASSAAEATAIQPKATQPKATKAKATGSKATAPKTAKPKAAAPKPTAKLVEGRGPGKADL